MDLSKKKAKISKDILGNEIKTYKLTKEELEEYLKELKKAKTDEAKEKIESYFSKVGGKTAITEAGSAVAVVKDYQTLKQTDVKTGDVHDLDFPCTSNVIQYFTEDGIKVSIRPSGTEPKIKFYFGVKEPLASVEEFEAVEAKLEAKIEQIKKDLNLL